MSTHRRIPRFALAGVCALSLLLATAACANSKADDGSASRQSSGEWSFEDARGVEVTLESPPERVVADTYTAASLWDFGVRPVGIFGWGLEENSAWANTLGNLDIDRSRSSDAALN